MPQNKLKFEHSPYLLQHADQPVNWYPWGEEAFELAKKLDKPVFLSIGYSTCHWCHVMAHESFDDPEVARQINDTFIPIKVDREERPDVDHLYMSVCQLLTGSGGWPLTVFLLPTQEPFFAGTYFPKHSIGQRMGVIELCERIRELWTTDKPGVEESARSILQAIQSAESAPAEASPVSVPALDAAYHQCRQLFDWTHGGFGSAPKFPTPHQLLYLVRYAWRHPESDALKMVEITLQKMRTSGIYDALGFGYHRYATDAEWKVPHFEKMLYDQALLCWAYTETYQLTQNPFYQTAANEIIAYVLRDLRSPEGGFYAGEDADSEGEEGKFYTWQSQEIHSLLSPEEWEIARQFWAIREDGNFRDEATRRKTGFNILHCDYPPEEIAQKLQLSPAELATQIDTIRRKLNDRRTHRVRPSRDHKQMTDWTSLMITALAKAGGLKPAKDAFRFIETHLKEGAQLFHVKAGPEKRIAGFASDYAWFATAALELFEATGDTHYLNTAVTTIETAIQTFQDPQTGTFFTSSESSNGVLIRQKETLDYAIPSPNSTLYLVLAKLTALTQNPRLKEARDALRQGGSIGIAQYPMAHTFWLIGLDFSENPHYKLSISRGKDTQKTEAELNILNQTFLPNCVKAPESPDAAEPTGQAPIFQPCDDQSCKSPASSVEALLKEVAP